MNHPALNAKHTYRALLRWHTKRGHLNSATKQEVPDDVKAKVEEATGPRPMSEKLLKGVRALGVPPRLNDHMRCSLTGRIKCGSFWNEIPGCAERALYMLVLQKENIDALESEQHMWLECENSGHALAWGTASNIWRKTTHRDWSKRLDRLDQGCSRFVLQIRPQQRLRETRHPDFYDNMGDMEIN